MAFKTFQRVLYAKLESTEGTWATPDLRSDYIEVIEPTFTITNRTFERNPTRNSITPAVMHVAGDDTYFTSGTPNTSPSAQVEISFTVEMAGSGTAGTAPRWSRLLQACGFTEVTSLKKASIGTLAEGSNQTNAVLLHKENISSKAAGTGYTTADRVGRVISDTFRDDGDVYFVKNTAVTTVTSGDKIYGELDSKVGGANATASSNEAASGVAWILGSGAELGSGDSSSLSMRLAFEATNVTTDNTHIDIKGCRGNVEFVFVAGDRVLMNFTFIGNLHGFNDSATLSPVAEGRAIPPAFMNVALGLGTSSFGDSTAADFTSSVFSNMTINLNNDLVLRDGASFTGGYDSTYITGRNTQMTFDPDSYDTGTSPTLNLWERFLKGDLMRGRMTVGATSGNKFLLKFPAAQISNIGDGNRDEVMTYDTTATLTGGDYGSSIKSDYDDSNDGDANAIMNSRNGTNNEFVLFHL